MADEPKPLATLTNGNLGRQHMPKDYSISAANYYRGGTDRFLLNPKGKRTQPMKGFEEEYTDIIDYIDRGKIEYHFTRFVFQYPADSFDNSRGIDIDITFDIKYHYALLLSRPHSHCFPSLYPDRRR